MSESIWLAQRFALELNGTALGILEAAYLLANKKTTDEGRTKIKRIRSKIEDYRKKPAYSDSLKVYLQEDFNPFEYISILDRLETDKKKVLPDIKQLIDKTEKCIYEARRARTDIKKPF